MLSIIAIILSSIAILLMTIILIRFKKLFSTESIIEKTRKQMNRMIQDINNNANMDIELINESTRRTRALINEADKKMEIFKEATQRLRDMIAEAEKISSKSKRNIIFNKNPIPEIPPVGSKRKNNPYIDPNSSYEIVKKNDLQQSLFEDEETTSVLKDEVKVTPEGAAYKEVPLIITKVYNDRQVENKKISAKDLPDKVEKLFKTGMNVEEIAAELSCSISEVAFIIDMLN